MLTENKIATSSRMMLIFDLGRVYECLWVEDILIKFLRSLAILWHSITHTSAPSVSKTIIHAVVMFIVAKESNSSMYHAVQICTWSFGPIRIIWDELNCEPLRGLMVMLENCWSYCMWHASRACCWQQWLNEHSYTFKSNSRWLYTTDIHQDCNCSSGRLMASQPISEQM